jgi:hypothetical protein
MDAGIVAAAAVNLVLLTVVLIQLARVSRQLEASDAALADVRRLQEEQADLGADMVRNQAHLRGSLRTLCARTDELLDRLRGIERREDKCPSYPAVGTDLWDNLLPAPPRRSLDGYQTADTMSLPAQCLNVRAPPSTPTSAARGERRTPSDPALALDAQPPRPTRSSQKPRTAPGGAAAPHTLAAASSRDADGPSPKSTREAQQQLGQEERTLPAPVGYEYFREDDQAGLIARDTSRPVHSSKGRSATSRTGGRSTVLGRSTQSKGATEEGVHPSPRNAMEEFTKMGSWAAGQLRTGLPSPGPQRRSSSSASKSSGSRFYTHGVKYQEAPWKDDNGKPRHAVGSQGIGRAMGAAHEPQATVPQGRPQEPGDLCQTPLPPPPLVRCSYSS